MRIADIRLASTEQPGHHPTMGDSQRQEAREDAAQPSDMQAAVPAIEEGEQVDIHKPKPVHSWRELFSEIGVIVIGVLIALAAEAAVEAVHWHDRVAEGRKAFRGNLASLLWLAQQRASLAPCVDRRLDELADVLGRATQTRKLPPLGAISSPGLPTWSTSAWDAYGTETLAHFPEAERKALGGAFRFTTILRERSQAETDAWLTLAMMVGPGRPLDPVSEGDLYRALSVARATNRSLASAATFLKGSLTADGVSADYAQSVDGPPKGQVAVSHICEPITSNVPSRYGQNPSAGAASVYRLRSAAGQSGAH